MRPQTVLLMVLMAAGVPALACGGNDTDLPAPNGSDVWSFLQDSDYRQNWEPWPGKGELYLGGEPYGALFTTYLNPTAFDALTKQTGTIPEGGIIITKNYTPEAVFNLVTVMYKVAGFDPQNANWFWAKIGAARDVQAEGKLEGCQACHGGDRANDFVLTGRLK
jgi:hypothetical protein